MSENTDDTFLARWLNNELTEEERKKFESSDEYHQYRKIIAATDNILPEPFDTDNILSKVKDSKKSIGQSDKRSKKANNFWKYGVAAAIILLVSFFYFYRKDTKVTTDFGEKIAVTLPDGSEMVVNARSEAIYNSGNWNNERKIDLAGEAYFKVESGNKFTVETNKGNVSVLGTEFNVQSMDGLFSVTCYEGKVKVVTETSEHILLPGKSFRSLDGLESLEDTREKSPGWTTNFSSFRSMPVKYVILALENQFNLKFQYDKLPADQVYTGSFPHDDREAALNIVFDALQIDFELKDNGTVLIKN